MKEQLSRLAKVVSAAVGEHLRAALESGITLTSGETEIRIKGVIGKLDVTVRTLKTVEAI